MAAPAVSAREVRVTGRGILLKRQRLGDLAAHTLALHE